MRVLLIVFTLLTVASIAAQSNQTCSSVSVETSAETVDRTDKPIVFNARLKDGVAVEGLEYKWKTSGGTITAGQNTSSITVDIVGLGGQSITATIEIVGLKDPCSTASGTVRVIEEPFVCGLALDQYGDIRFADEKSRLDNFAIQLMNQPSSRGALITFAGNPTYKGEVDFRLRRAKNYLVNVRKIAPERLITTKAGYRTELTTLLYIVPEGASLPVLDSIPVSGVRFTKPRPKVNRKSSRR